MEFFAIAMIYDLRGPSDLHGRSMVENVSQDLTQSHRSLSGVTREMHPSVTPIAIGA